MSSRNGAAHPSTRNRLATLPSDEPSLEARKRQAVKALHEQFDQLNALWAEKEKELVEMNVPARVWYRYKTEYSEHEPTAYYYLVVGKWRGKWRLLHAITDPQDRSEPDEKPIVEASLDDRLEAAQHFEKLREKVIEAAEQSVAKVQDAIKALSL